MKPCYSFHVRPRTPERIAALDRLARNLRWSWHHETISLFRRLDRDRWEETGHNPVLMLGLVPQERLEEAARDEAFLAHLDRVTSDLDDYLGHAGTWYRKNFGAAPGPAVAYFSMEYGLTECLPIYSGGLGILASDHLKSASELGLPLVGVGLLYQKGYFRQYLNAEGWQKESQPENDFSTMPLRLFRNAAGEPITIGVDLAGRMARAQLWEVAVGRVTLVLLDTNVPQNPRDIQDITDALYGGDEETRLRQEIVLGVGGMRALDALGLRARVYHMNEGHSAFVALERLRLLMSEHGLSLDEAFEVARASSIFTTHTPVPAGIDVFPRHLTERYLGSYCRDLGIAVDALHRLGSMPAGGDPDAPLNMAVLAIRNSGLTNAVSRIHGRVSRAMWTRLWPGVPADDLPITHVTNGVHPGSWISDDLRNLFDRYLGPRWAEEPGDTRIWQRAAQIPAEELWRTHERRRERLVAFARRRLAAQLRSRGAGSAEVAAGAEVLDPEALTIGFARRFATYKRATLLLRDPERLARLVNAPGRPVQVLYAGKAHPRDDEGKALIAEVVRLARRPEFRRRIVFLEDYDQVVARYLVQGVDVWLNTPRRPLEASGTSGMKAAMNGALNLSVLDGWWDEACTPATGWAIGNGEEDSDPAEQDRVEAGALYDRLERDIVPLFYERGADGLPRGWIDLMKSAIEALCPVFNTNRMVHEYTRAGYRPALERRERLEADNFRGARELAAWRRRVHEAWPGVRVEDGGTSAGPEVISGDEVEVNALVTSGGLGPEELDVQVYYGRVNGAGDIEGAQAVSMTAGPSHADGRLRYSARIRCERSGRSGFTVRVLPRHAALTHPQETGLIAWASCVPGGHHEHDRDRNRDANRDGDGDDNRNRVEAEDSALITR